MVASTVPVAKKLRVAATLNELGNASESYVNWKEARQVGVVELQRRDLQNLLEAV